MRLYLDATRTIFSFNQILLHMEEWFVSGASNGFAIQPDVSFDGVRDFVDEVTPILQERGLFHEEYEGETLREHMGIPYQYGMME